MQLIQLDPINPDKSSGARPEAVVTIGKFDGVHQGHHVLLDEVVKGAKRSGALPAVVVLEPHPSTVLQPDLPLNQLTTLPEKLWLLNRAGMQLAVIWHFSSQSALLTPSQFFQSLRAVMHICAVVIGPGFVLGRDRTGDEASLRMIGQAQDFRVTSILPANIAGQPVGSTQIRALLSAGDVAKAARLLGRLPGLHARVVPGDRRGRLLGFPTANLAPVASNAAIPADGVYAAWVELNPLTLKRTWHPAVVNLGARPTFGGRRHVNEAHLLDFDGDLYGQEVRLHFLERLRGEKIFETKDELQQQIGLDSATARSILDNRESPEDLW